MKRHFFLMLLLLPACFLSACAVTQVGLRPDFFKNNKDKIGVLIEAYPKGASYRVNEQKNGATLGLLGVVIDSVASSVHEKMMAALNDYLGKYLPEEFNFVADDFVKKFKEKGIYAINLGIIDLKEYKDCSESEGCYRKDLRSLSGKFKVDKVLLLEVEKFGSLRHYNGVATIDNPNGYFQVTGRLINLSNNQIEWLEQMEEKNSRVGVSGAWDQPPNYPNFTVALRYAIKYARRYLPAKFFGEKVKAFDDSELIH